MKKIFRMALVFALAGATLMYTGCSKDYTEDINNAMLDSDALSSPEATPFAIDDAQLIAKLREQGLSIAVAFDSDPALDGLVVHGIRVRPMKDLVRLVRRLSLQLGILTVPEEAAQSCADLLVAAGVRGLWNFSPVQLDVPAGVVVQNMDLAQSLAVLSHSLETVATPHTPTPAP
jgi:hypothetical protein